MFLCIALNLFVFELGTLKIYLVAGCKTQIFNENVIPIVARKIVPKKYIDPKSLYDKPKSVVIILVEGYWLFNSKSLETFTLSLLQTLWPMSNFKQYLLK